MGAIEVIGLDADDTLWHNETLYSGTQEKYRALLAPYHDAAWIDHKLHETEMRNLGRFGYGIKGFTLSMIETAIELTEGRITGREIQTIVDFAKEMLAAPVELLPCVRETVAALSAKHPLYLITKGDLFDQETKVAMSGLADYFARVEIISEKSAPAYAALLARHGVTVARFVMVGNSLRSDILPVLGIGGQAVYVPYAITWQHEMAELAANTPAFHQLASICDLPELITRLDEGEGL